jgi:membrane protease YdiL (CAAX protease family)
MILKNNKGHIRCGWKILITYLLLFAIITVVNICFGIVVGTVSVVKGNNNISELEKFLSGDIGILITCILNNTSSILASIFVWKLLDKKKVKDMGIISINEGKKDLFVGLLMGALSITIVCIILLLFGGVQFVNPISKPNISISIIYGLISFIFVGLGEEIFGRAYVMSVLKQTKNKWVIIFISSILFSALHLFNNAIGILSLINLFLAGVLFAYMFMKSNNIWLPIGFHITWNYFQGYIWGFQVSGNKVNGIYQIKTITNNIINGGEFGPEGGLVVTSILLILLFFVRFYYSDKKIEDFIYNDEEIGIIKYN